MADLVLALGTSHTPLLCLSPDDWEQRAAHDRVYPHHDADGSRITYEALLERANGRFAAIATPARWNASAEIAQRNLDKLAEILAQARPDVVIVVGDDQHELFSSANNPAIAIYHGAIATSHPMAISDEPHEQWRKTVAPGYGMDAPRPFAAHPAFARELIERLVEDGFDVAAAETVPEPEKQGFGHAYGFVVTRLMGEKKIPIVPVLLNTYYPPNQPTPARCYDLGAALRRAIDASPSALRVAIVASGGLSHFVTNEELDTRVLDALRSDDRSALRALPRPALLDGSSEILNWVTVGGAIGGMKPRAMEYSPVYRTPAGTGIGLGFAAFS